MSFTIVRVEQHAENDRRGLLAEVEINRHTFFFSQLEGERPFWIADAHLAPNGYPHFVNGFGSRVTQLVGATDPELVAALDEAAREVTA